MRWRTSGISRIADMSTSGETIRFRSRHVWDSLEITLKVLAAAVGRLPPEVIHRHHDRHLLGGGRGQEPADRVALLRRERFDIVLQRVRQFNRYLAHTLVRISFRKLRGGSAITPSCSEPLKSFTLWVRI